MLKKVVLALCAAFLLTSAPALADNDRRDHRRGAPQWHQGHDGKHWNKHPIKHQGKHQKHWNKHKKHGRTVVIWHGHRHASPPRRHHHHHPKQVHRHHYDRRAGHDSWALYAILALQLAERLSDSQQQHYAWAQQRAVAAPLGESIEWHDSGMYGSVTPVRDGADGGGRYCREFQHHVTVGNRQQSAYGVACRQPDGAWEIVAR